MAVPVVILVAVVMSVRAALAVVLTIMLMILIILPVRPDFFFRRCFVLPFMIPVGRILLLALSLALIIVPVERVLLFSFGLILGFGEDSVASALGIYAVEHGTVFNVASIAGVDHSAVVVVDGWASRSITLSVRRLLQDFEQAWVSVEGCSESCDDQRCYDYDCAELTKNAALLVLFGRFLPFFHSAVLLHLDACID